LGTGTTEATPSLRNGTFRILRFHRLWQNSLFCRNFLSL
jgi:hypothetical protein